MARSRDDAERLLMEGLGRHSARKAPEPVTVRLRRDGQLWAVWRVFGDQEMWYAGFLTEEARSLYLSWHPEWKIAPDV